jgi:hypothetical protein
MENGGCSLDSFQAFFVFTFIGYGAFRLMYGLIELCKKVIKKLGMVVSNGIREPSCFCIEIAYEYDDQGNTHRDKQNTSATIDPESMILFPVEK